MPLDNILEDAVQRAIRSGSAFVALGRGLNVQMKLVNACILQLSLSRRDTLPSDVEWGTICKYFPWEIKSKPSRLGNEMTVNLAIHPKYLPGLQIPLPLDPRDRLT